MVPLHLKAVVFAIAVAFLALLVQLAIGVYHPQLSMVPLRLNSSSLHGAIRRLPFRAVSQFSSPSISRPSSRTTSQSHIRSFSSSPNMASTTSFMDAIKARRSYYALNKEAPISGDKIEQLVNDTVLHVPSSFNSQSTRLVVLLKEQHDLFWDMVMEALKAMVPEDQFPSTEKKINGFKAGYGTVSMTHEPALTRRKKRPIQVYHNFRRFRRELRS